MSVRLKITQIMDKIVSIVRPRKRDTDGLIPVDAQPIAQNAPVSGQKGSLPSSVTNFANTIMGSGILALPFAFRASGIVMGIMLLIAVALVQDYTVLLLRKSGEMTKQRTYGAVAMYAFGPKAAVIVDVCVVLQTFGVCIAYIVIIGELFPPILSGWIFGGDTTTWMVHRITIMALFTWLVIFPLCLLKRIDSLKYTSYIALLAILYLVVYVVYRSSELGLKEEPVYFRTDLGMFLTVPIISLAYTCHFNWFPIRKELKNPTEFRQIALIHVTFLVVTLLYLLVGAFGYVTFYEEVKGNILVNYLGDDIFVTIGRFGVSLTVTFSFPILAFSTRQALDRLLFPKDPSFASRNAEGEMERREMKKLRLRTIMISAVICLCGLLMAILIPNIAFILGLVGATSSTTICYIFPALFFLKMARDWNGSSNSSHIDEEEESEEGEVEVDTLNLIETTPETAMNWKFRYFGWLRPRDQSMKKHVIPAIAVISLGLLFGVVGTYETIISGD